MPTKKELERKNSSLQNHVILYTIIIIMCMVVIVWLTFENMMLQPFRSDKAEPSEPCFYSWDLSYNCGKTGWHLTAKIENNTKYWVCGDLYEVRAC